MTHYDGPGDSAVPSTHRVGAGSLLVASTDLLAPTFRRTVVYMIEHNDSGSLGVVLNRPSDTAVHTVLPEWSDLARRPKAMFVGGPVKRDAALCLGVLKPGAQADDAEGLRTVRGRVVMIDLDSDAALATPLLAGVRIFAGYSGWSMGQLDGELGRGDWMVFDGHDDDVLADPRTDVWATVLRREPMPIPLLATHPIDLSRN